MRRLADLLLARAAAFCIYYIVGLVMRRRAWYARPSRLEHAGACAAGSHRRLCLVRQLIQPHALHPDHIVAHACPRLALHTTARSSGHARQPRARFNVAMPEPAAAGGGKAAARARAAAQEAALSVSVQKFTRGGQARRRGLAG